MTKKSVHPRFFFMLLCCSISMLRAERVADNCLFTLNVGHESAFPAGVEVCVPVSTQNFIDMVSMEFSLTWNNSVLDFQEIINLQSDLWELQYNETSPGVLKVIWVDAGLDLNTFSDNTVLFELCFTAVGALGSGTAISFMPNQTIEFGDSSGPIPSTLTGGSVWIEDFTAPQTLSISEDCGAATSCTALNVIISGGQSPYSYSWSGPNNFTSTAEDLPVVPSGSYSLTVTDANGDNLSATFSVWNSFALQLSANVTPANCLVPNSASIQLTPTNGTPPYTFVWSNGATTADISNLNIGAYSVTATDANGCEIMTTYQVEQQIPLLHSTYTCDANDLANLTVSVLNNQEDYTFEFSTGAVISGSASATISDVSSGAYSVTVTGQTSGCSEVLDQINVLCPAGGTNTDCFTFIASNETAAATGDEVCVSVTVKNFTDLFGYQYSMHWDTSVLSFLSLENTFIEPFNGNAGTNNASLGWVNFLWTTSTAILPESFPDGTLLYDICFEIVGSPGESSLVEFKAMPLTFEVIGLNGSGVVSELPCVWIGGSVGIEPIANNTLTFLDGCPSSLSCNGNSSGNGNIDVSIGGGQSPYSYNWSGANGFAATSEDITALEDGVYYLTVTDADGSALPVSFILETGPVAISATVTPDDCAMGSNGAIDISFTNGTPPYTFAWSNGTTTEDINNLLSGNYTVTVTDANACSATQQFTVVDNDLTNAISASIQPATCSLADGAISLQVPGDANDYTYEWSNGATTGNISNLATGSYTVTVTSITGSCTAVKTYSVYNAGLFGDITYNCNNGLVELTALAWNNAEEYTFEFSNGMIASDSLFVTIPDLDSGTYSVTVTGQTTGCVTTAGPIVAQCPPPADCFTLIANSANANTGDQICIPITTTGYNNILGLQFSLVWDTLVLDYTGTNEAAIPTINFINDLINGQFSLAWIHSDPNGNGLTLADGSTLFEVCFDVIGAAGTQSAFSITNTPTDIEAVTSNNTLPEEISFHAIQGQVLVANPLVAPVINDICGTAPGCGGSNGSATVTVTGGLVPYSYAWTDANGNMVGTSPTIDFVSGNYFEVVITDANGMTASGFVDVLLDGPDVIANWVNHVNCFGTENGSINLTVTGGAAPYSYSWSNGASTEDLNNLPAGAYSLTITDANGCSTTQNYFVSEPGTPLGLELVSTTCPSAAGNDGSLEVLASGGVVPYNFSWSSGANNAISNGLAVGNYEVMLTDAAGCTLVASFFVGDCVWPGDTDTSKVVNHFDLLNVGLASGTSGTTRPNASINWTAQPSPNWPESTPNSNVNYKHIDTDGNGLIEDLDTMAIVQNWGEMHNFTGDPDQQFGPGLPPNGNLLSLPFYVQPDTIAAGATVALPVILGDDNNLVTDLYGLAFSITFDPTVVVPGSAYLRFEDSWVGAIYDNMIAIQKTYHADGRLDVAMTRMDGNNINGQGIIAHFFITIEDDVVFKPEDEENKSLLFVETIFGIENVRLITNQEEEILSTPTATTTVIESTSTATADWDGADTIMLYPNPVANQLYIHSPLAAIESVRVYDITGRILQTTNYQLVKEVVLNTNLLKEGAYLVKIQTEKGQVVHRIIVMK